MYCVKGAFNVLSKRPVATINKISLLNNNAIKTSHYNVLFSSFNHNKLCNLKYDLKNFSQIEFHSRNRNFKSSFSRIVLYRSFKTSEPRKIHPIFWFVFKPFLKLTAILTGRGFRKWWRDLPKDKKRHFINVMIINKKKIAASVLVFVLLSLGFYISHIEETPITKRKRFMAFSTKQLAEINAFELKQLMENLGPQIIPSSHPATLRVIRIVNRILQANQDIQEIHGKQWGVSIIDSPIENAFVLPIGHVFVFTGMLKLCTNDDQLGGILAHEIAHCLQNHGAENISFTHLLDMVSIFIIAAIWAVLPSDIISFLTHWVYQKSLEILLQLPYNRKIETEADTVGLQLAAKACFDVRECSAFWSKMAILKKTFGDNQQIEFLSTHPSHEKRSEYLDTIMDKAISLRKDSGCPDLKSRDPRLDVEGVSKALELARRQYLERNPKPVIVY
ncbi:metalloendopeptidase OMA1, mitochondrial [Parasteatoda tepidariorum]|uniref:metalloendopeptidase OMA1, mitochondrial n=1 Tax=Parasteatoda tepidariorum TaxID=114398 RepID=UPI001C72670B|nr:metalloendopeptidase OMA1, mitochondrial [Parasteatoda tepidariorum]